MDPIVVVFLVGCVAILVAGIKQGMDPKFRNKKYERDFRDLKKECSECTKRIPEAAKRCPFCTSEQPRNSF